MKTSYIFGIALFLIVLIFVLVAAVNFEHPVASAKDLSAAAFSLQTDSPTPRVEGISEVGSTDGIVIMGFVLVIVVMVPLIFRRKRK